MPSSLCAWCNAEIASNNHRCPGYCSNLCQQSAHDDIEQRRREQRARRAKNRAYQASRR